MVIERMIGSQCLRVSERISPVNEFKKEIPNNQNTEVLISSWISFKQLEGGSELNDINWRHEAKGID